MSSTGSGAGLLAFSVAWLTSGLSQLVAYSSLNLFGVLLVPIGWAVWSLVGAMLMILGIASLSSELLTEQAERQRLQALATIRLCDYAFRYAGDEFLVLMPATGMKEAQGVAERIRRIVDEEQSLPGLAGPCRALPGRSA